MPYAPWTGPWEAIVVRGDNITPALLCWRRYRRPYPGVLENMLDMNPHILEGLALSPYLPDGAIVRLPIDRSLIDRAPKTVKQATLVGQQ